MDLYQAEKLFQKYYDRLIVETLHARAHLNLWERLEKYKATDYIDELNQARYFFTFTEKAHLENVLLTLSRILDKRNKKSLSVWEFLNFVDKNQEIFSTQVFSQRIKDNPYYKSLTESHTPITSKKVDEDRQKLGELGRTLNNLTTWRNKVIAHIDQQFLLSGKIVAEECPLQLQQLQEVVGTLFEILNRYSGAFNSSSYAERYPGEDDIQFVMDCIRFFIEEHDKQIQAELEALKKNK